MGPLFAVIFGFFAGLFMIWRGRVAIKTRYIANSAKSAFFTGVTHYEGDAAVRSGWFLVVMGGIVSGICALLLMLAGLSLLAAIAHVAATGGENRRSLEISQVADENGEMVTRAVDQDGIEYFGAEAEAMARDRGIPMSGNGQNAGGPGAGGRGGRGGNGRGGNGRGMMGRDGMPEFPDPNDFASGLPDPEVTEREFDRMREESEAQMREAREAHNRAMEEHQQMMEENLRNIGGGVPPNFGPGGSPPTGFGNIPGQRGGPPTNMGQGRNRGNLNRNAGRGDVRGSSGRGGSGQGGSGQGGSGQGGTGQIGSGRGGNDQSEFEAEDLPPENIDPGSPNIVLPVVTYDPQKAIRSHVVGFDLAKGETADEPPDGGVIVGMVIGVSNDMRKSVVNVQPVYQCGDKYVKGDILGPDGGHKTLVMAPPGSAVYGIEVHSTTQIDAIRLGFMPVNERGKLDKKSPKASRWVGEEGMMDAELIDGEGKAIVSVFGLFTSGKLSALGLYAARSVRVSERVPMVRDWKSNNGHTTRAQYVRHSGNSVVLRLAEDGREIEVEVSALSPEDQTWIQEQ